MKGVIRKWGNSAALRLPASALRDGGFTNEQAVEITVSRGRIVIEPQRRVEYRLDALLESIESAQVHGETDTGTPVGREEW